MSVANYDTWKAEKPGDDAEDGEIFGECDCCSKQRALSRCWTSDGLETYACNQCRGAQ